MLRVLPYHSKIVPFLPRLSISYPSHLQPCIYTRSFTSSRPRRQSSKSPSVSTPESLPPHVPIDEEKLPRYRPEDYYPANPGGVLGEQYELKAKVGWGSTSTVWLAQDISSERLFKPNRFVALKICNSDAADEDTNHELDVNMHLSSINSTHRGRTILGTAFEAFSIDSPRGSSHLALVFKPMREPLWLFRRRLGGQNKITRPFLPVIKAYLQILLEGLDYLHSECHVIHTGKLLVNLKLDNIMVTFEDESVIEDFVQSQAAHPMARKIVGERTVYRCHNNFGALKGDINAIRKMYPKITDFGLVQRGDQARPLIHPIQPNDCHAPEVLLGTGWSYSADIWNLAIIVWDLLTGQSLFQQERSYSASQHLADMIALLGPVPPAMLQRERDMRHWRWRPEVHNPQGELSSNAAEFFGGPFFSDDGTFLHKDLMPSSRNLENELPECIPVAEADLFFAFMRRMLFWVPEERATAAELKLDPWLN
ncbi:hypothetical protein NM208_g363 [Fusarium decemcellulare]|uniref:Uncharacterized protein n=1 Tax=Fusarium decemcellulare TaxID=57161 RepID=A0ACC1SZK1_9HYPO|nr:hypothetical protein NM208_g363 [Fusarium decemcellulare]